MEELECFSCDAVFTVDHDLDDDYYKKKICHGMTGTRTNK
jgi:hypothetical protein